jgi:hypothetical protein
MSRDASLTLPLGAEEYLFRLGLAEERKIEETCDAGLGELARRLAPAMRFAQATAASTPEQRRGLFTQAIAGGALGECRVDDYRAVLHQGLIGGKQVEPTLAGLLIREHVDGKPRLQFMLMAFQLVMETIVGAEDEPLGETNGATTAAPPKPRSRAKRPAGRTSTRSAR